MLSLVFPPGMDPLVLIGLAAVSFGTSLMTAAFGIGGGVAMLGVLASTLPPAALIPVHGVIQLGSNAGRAVVLRRHTLWPVILPFLGGSAIGVAIGGALSVQLPSELVQIGIGLFIIWSVFIKPPVFMRRAAVPAGAVSSFLTMFFGATGPFVASYLKTVAPNRHAQSATHAVCMTIQHLLKTFAFGFLGFSFTPYLGFIAMMMASGFLGTLAGRQVLNRIDDALFRKALNTILLLMALRLLWIGGSELLG